MKTGFVKRAFLRLLDAVDQSVAAAVPVGPAGAEASCGPTETAAGPCERMVAYAWGRSEGDLAVVFSSVRVS